MLSHSKLPKSFWGEAMRTSIDLINLSPSVPLKGDVPERVWTGKNVSYDNLRVFGCKAFVHIPKDERSKLNVKAKPCIFLGYGHEEFGYRLWDPLSRKIVRNRDVVFLEDKLVDDCNKVGHVRKECRIWKKEQNDVKKENKETNAIAAEGDIMIVTDDGCVSLATQDSNWVIDSGASFHVTSHIDFFTSYKTGDFGNVRMGNNGVSKIVGIGDVCLETSIGNKLVLKDVRYVPDISLNLIS